MQNETTCNYTIYNPSEHGYTDMEGLYYKCTCGACYIDIEDALEWTFCPHCGTEIDKREQLLCVTCLHTELEEGDYYCTHDDGVHYCEYITDMDFEGCKQYEKRPDAKTVYNSVSGKNVIVVD